MDAVELKAKKKGGKDKSALSKTGLNTGLLSHVNENVNMFSQLSAMYLSQNADKSEEVNKFLASTDDKQVFTQHSYDPEIQFCLNQMNKKSQITKLKAFSSLKDILQKQPEEFFDQFVSTWTYLYKQFVNSEHERKVFEESNQVLIIIISKNRKSLQSSFKELFPYWFLQMSDPSPDVALVASQAFDKMMPKEKQCQAFSICQEAYLLNLKYYLTITLKQIQSENNNLSEHEAQEIYDRLVVSSLNSISKAIELNAQSKEPQNFLKKLEDLLFTERRSPIIDLLSKKRVKVRAGVLDVLQTLLQNVSNETLEQQIEVISKQVLPMIDERERLIQLSLWKGCLLSLMEKIPSNVLIKCDLKMIETKLMDVLRRAASGIGKLFYSHLSHFLSKLPMANFSALTLKPAEEREKDNKNALKFNVEEYVKERFAFIKKFFESMLAGFAHDEIKFFGDHLVQAYFECVYFVVLKRISIVLAREELKPLKNLQKQGRNLIRDIVCNFLNVYLNEHLPDNQMSPFKQVPNSFAQLLNLFTREQFGGEENLFEELIAEFGGMFSKAKKDPTKFQNYLLLLQSIAGTVGKNSLVFDELDVQAQQMHSEILTDLKQELKPLMNDSHIEKMLPICTQYKQYAALFNFQSKTNAINSNISSLGIFENLLASQTTAALQTISFTVQAIIQNIKTITNQASLEKFTTFIAQIYFAWAESITETHPEYNEFQNVLTDITNHIKMLNQVDPKALLHLQFVFHFAHPETNATFFSVFSQQNTKNKPIDDSVILRSLSSLETSKSNPDKQKRLQQNAEHQKLCLSLSQHIFLRMDRYLGVSLPLLVTIFKSYLNNENKMILVEQLKNSMAKKRQSLFTKEVEEKQVSRIIDELEYCYFFCVQIYKEIPTESGSSNLEFFDDFFQIVFFCLERRLRSRVSQAFRLLKYLLADKLALDKVMENAQSIILSSLQCIFIQKEQKDTQFETLLRMISETFTFLKTTNKKDHIISLAGVILQPQFFENIIFDQRNWTLLQVVFEQLSTSIDLNEYLHSLLTNQKGYWLITSLISSSQVIAILNSIKLKKYFRDLSYNFIKPLIHTAIENEFEEVILFLKEMMRASVEKSLAFGHALRACLKQMICDGMDPSKQGRIFSELVKVKLEEFLTIQSSDLMMREGIVIKNLMPLFTEQLESEEGERLLATLSLRLSEVSRKRVNEISSLEKINSLIVLDILISSFSNEFYSGEGQQIQVREYMMQNFVQFEADNYATAVFFAFLNFLLEKVGVEPLLEHLVTIENHLRKSIEFNAKPRKYSSHALANILTFLRKVIHLSSLKFSGDFKEFALQNVMDTCLLKLAEFESSGHSCIDSTLLVDESNDVLIIEFAETISRFVTVLTDHFDENMAYELLNCSYPAIQKSTFLLLRQFYTAFSPSTDLNLASQPADIDLEDKLLNSLTNNPHINLDNLLKFLDVRNIILTEQENKELQRQQANVQAQSENTLAVKEMAANDDEDEDHDVFEKKDIIDPSTYGHLLTWISFVNKLNAPETNEQHELLKKALKLYLDEHKELHKNFLTILFQWIEFLDIPDSHQKDILSVEEVQTVNPEWSDFLSNESLFQLLVQSLYIFSSKFPYYLRHWLENTAEKKFIKVAENLIKNFISNALYLKEVETIELSQIEWQSEEFKIYVTKKTREINAVYMKEGQKLEINLKIPLEYPIKHIQTEVKRGMKVNQQKTNKWMLMMKSLLFNQNNTIKNALIMWKDNLDKELEGLDECAICYYVINSTSGELPKLPCKTCKKKFHSSCIHRWFKSSNKSECPLCKSQFL